MSNMKRVESLSGYGKSSVLTTLFTVNSCVQSISAQAPGTLADNDPLSQSNGALSFLHLRGVHTCTSENIKQLFFP